MGGGGVTLKNGVCFVTAYNAVLTVITCFFFFCPQCKYFIGDILKVSDNISVNKKRLLLTVMIKF